MFSELSLLLSLHACTKFIVLANHTNTSRDKLVQYLGSQTPDTTCLVLLNCTDDLATIPSDMLRKFLVVIHVRRWDAQHKRYAGLDPLENLPNVIRLYMNGDRSPKRGIFINWSRMSNEYEAAQAELNSHNSRRNEVTTGFAVGTILRRTTNIPVELIGFSDDSCPSGTGYHNFFLEHKVLDEIGCKRIDLSASVKDTPPTQ